ncbi:MAG TPA: ABC transporter permease [Gemmatimonadales bacterium]|nr:ABC transporter permease [Gemmatimonadales bacterium]
MALGRLDARTSESVALGLHVVASAVLVTLLGLPVVALFLRVPPARLLARFRDDALLEALRLSLLTSVAATLVVMLLGLPVAYLLATKRFPGKRLLEVLLELPMVLPPTVAGVGLLLAFGRQGLAGGALGALGLSLPFSTLAVIVAQSFVAAPFFIAATRAGLAEVDRRYLDAAATLRSPPSRTLFRVMLPLALPSLVAGAAMTWARALGEFGATITFAGNMPGVTQTMPLAVYLALQTDLDAAVAMSVLMLTLSLGVLLGVRLAAPGLLPAGHRARASTR